MDDATYERLALRLDYHDTGSPTEADVQALWRAYKALEVERDQHRNACRHWEDQAAIWHQEQAQAAPVLVAAEAWHDSPPSDAWQWGAGALHAAVVAWRAAREE